jgi:hypothetical protein
MSKSSIDRMPFAIGAVLAVCALNGCGLAETSAVTAAQAESAAEQAKQGKELEAQLQRDIEATQRAAAEARDKMEADDQ